MAVSEVEYTPDTANVNADRKYYIKNDIFIKVDDVISRGKNEAQVLKALNPVDHPFIQKYITSYEKDGKHYLETEYFKGKTLENCQLTDAHKILIQTQLLELLACLTIYQIKHADINVSNILFNGQQILLIDWETAETGNPLDDLFGDENHKGILNTLRML
tara:strand:+ start:1422 stop:1904 length:483 start_codon:yes stop_codon:yes gene_type:complete